MRMLFQQIRMGIWRRKSTMKTLTLIKQSFSTRHLKKVSLRKYFDNVFTAEVPCFIKNTFFITKPRIALSKKLGDYRHYGKMHQAKGAEELNQSQSVGTCIETCLSFRLCFQLRQSGFHQIISGTKRRSHKRSRKKMKRSDFSDSDSAELMNAFSIFTRSLTALKTPLTISTPTLSLVKTSLFWPSWGWASLHIRQAWIYSMYLKRYCNIRSCKLVFSVSENSSQLWRSRIKYLEAVCRLMIWLLNAMHCHQRHVLLAEKRLLSRHGPT